MSANVNIQIPRWKIAEMTGYKPKTTFWQDFWIAAQFGTDAVKNTFDRAFAEWKYDHTFMTELSLVLNHLGWTYHQKNDKLSRLFFLLWEELIDWCYENYEGEELDYFIRVTD